MYVHDIDEIEICDRVGCGAPIDGTPVRELPDADERYFCAAHREQPHWLSHGVEAMATYWDNVAAGCPPVEAREAAMAAEYEVTQQRCLSLAGDTSAPGVEEPSDA